MNLEGTETARSLMKAFAGESQARNRYTFYAQVARKEGLIQVASIFTVTASNEEAHAKEFFKAMNEGNLNQRTVDIAARRTRRAVSGICKNRGRRRFSGDLQAVHKYRHN